MNIVDIIRKLSGNEVYRQKYHMTADNILAISKVRIKREKTIESDEKIVESDGCIVRNSEFIVIIYDIDNDFDSHAILPDNDHYIRSMFTNLNLDFMTNHVNDSNKEINVEDILNELEEKENG